MTVAALVLGAGRGERLGAGEPKAFVLLDRRPLIAHAIDALLACSLIERVVPVVPLAGIDRFESLRTGLSDPGRVGRAVVGGARRQDSLRAGLEELGDCALVAVHDAARPLVRAEDVARVIEAARSPGAAILALPARDTIKLVEDGRIRETPPRSACWAAQTPQVMRREWLVEALDKAEQDGFDATDDAQLVERLGLPVRVVEGRASNLKITVEADLVAAEAWLRDRPSGAGRS
jgi:2-C-methyl-D-erythritol 4-phosphate cytidylyltransferase